MTSLSLISLLLRTIVSNSFDWLTRLFCSFPNHDTTLTVILNLHFQTKILLCGSRNDQHVLNLNVFVTYRLSLWKDSTSESFYYSLFMSELLNHNIKHVKQVLTGTLSGSIRFDKLVT